MKTMICVLMFGFATLLGVPGRAVADVNKVAPKDAVVLPDDGTGVTKVAFLFDLSKLRAGDNRHIEEALLDWWLTGLPSEEMSTFKAYPILNSWSRGTVEGGSAPSIQAESISDGQINPLIPLTIDGRLVRLDLTDIVAKWAAGTTANYGIVVAVPGISPQVLGDQLAKAQLTTRYGFRDN